MKGQGEGAGGRGRAERGRPGQPGGGSGFQPGSGEALPMVSVLEGLRGIFAL